MVTCVHHCILASNMVPGSQQKLGKHVLQEGRAMVGRRLRKCFLKFFPPKKSVSDIFQQDRGAHSEGLCLGRVTESLTGSLGDLREEKREEAAQAQKKTVSWGGTPVPSPPAPGLCG